jgi:hypothetical protein
MTIRFQGQQSGWSTPALNVAANNGTITPSDATTYNPPIRCLRVGTAGNLAIVLAGDSELDANKYVTLAVSAGEELTSYAIKQVRSTNTTAGGLLGFR